MREIWTRTDLSERARVFLAASVGALSVAEACEKLGISRQRFYELEDRAVGGFLRELAPKSAGRPARPKDPTAPLAKEIDKLKRENERLWLYIKVLQRLAGIESAEKKRRRPPKPGAPRGQAHDR